MIKIRLLRYLRWKAAKLGEYCNNHPFDKGAYGLYLTLIDLLY